MKEIILSADGDSIVYLVPDAVADNLENIALNFARYGFGQVLKQSGIEHKRVFAMEKQILLIT